MACIRERRGRYVLDYRDPTGRRIWRTFPHTAEGLARAEKELARVEAMDPGAVDPGITVAGYIAYWLEVVEARTSGLTLATYKRVMESYVPERMLRLRLADLTRPVLKSWLVYLKNKGYARNTIKQAWRTVSSMLSDALDDGIIAAHPAMRMGRLISMPRQDEVRSMDGEQWARFLEMARRSKEWPAIAVLTYTGLRGGEARGLQLSDVDLEARKLRVDRQVYQLGGVGPPKKGKTRTVDIADSLVEVLREQLVRRKEQDLRTGRRVPWLLFPWFSPVPTHKEARTAHRRVLRAVWVALKAAGLHDHGFTPHSLRHTFATLMLSRGETLLYVARQLGDTLGVTADVYGKHAQVPPSAGGTNLLKDEKG